MKEPTPDEVMNEAIKGAGFTKSGEPAARNIWRELLPIVEQMEKEAHALGVPANEAEQGIEIALRRIIGGILARHRYTAALRVKLNKPSRKRGRTRA